MKSGEGISGEGIGDRHSISCPLCGARSTLTVEVPVTKTKTWKHTCPVCCKAWKVKVWSERGKSRLMVESDLDLGKPKKKKS